MGDALRAAALVLLCAALAAAIPSAGDYTVELGPAMSALVGGDLHAFAGSAPVYGASAWPRAPFAAIADALGGGELAVYRAGAFACLLAAAALAWWLERRLRESGRPALDRWAVVAVIVGAPVVLRTLRDGHPEDVLAAVLAVTAVLAAARGRAIPAGLALGLAVMAKPWAVLAVLPVVLAAPRGRVLLLAAAGAAAAAVYLPILLLAEHRSGADLNAVVTTGRLFHPQQLFWPLREAQTLGGGVTAYTAPAWAARISHPAIVLAGVALTAIWGLRRRATGAEPEDALLALAACLMLRCLLDPWNLAYYAVPPMLALVAWEALRREGLPVLTLALGALTWLSFVALPRTLGWDALAATYLIWAVPFTSLLWVRLIHPAALAPLRRTLSSAAPGTQPASSATAARTSPSAT
jgi:hypothetical protein